MRRSSFKGIRATSGTLFQCVPNRLPTTGCMELACDICGRKQISHRGTEAQSTWWLSRQVLRAPVPLCEISSQILSACTTRARSDRACAAAFIDAEFGPDGKVIGDAFG